MFRQVFVALLVVCPTIASAQVSDTRKFCAQVRDDDTIRQLPRSLAVEAMKARRTDDGGKVDAKPSAGEVDDFANQTFFRCMNGLVFFCSVGANLPCTGKPDTRRSLPEVDRYCRQQRTSDFVPAYVTGHSAIYSWSCANGRAVIDGQAQLDQRGFIANIWTPLLN